MKRVAIVAAMVGELKPLVESGWMKIPTANKLVHKWAMTINDVEWIAVCAGMGADAARRAFAEAEVYGKLDGVLSVGWAGALDENLQASDLLIPNVVVDARTGERFFLAKRENDCVLVTTAMVANEVEKRRLAAAYSATVVDMEAAAVVRLAEMRGVPARCLKVISDEAGAKLPDLNRFIDRMGQMQMGKFLCYIALRPKYWMALGRLGGASAKAAECLAAAIVNFVNNDTREFLAGEK